ncbi:Cleavage and polyadenylation specificity factor subunit 3-II [Hordeum vulgare]|nr:Cleavage and polyadenylation specificity factor subunit 3-II [Hordeum vulgare]
MCSDATSGGNREVGGACEDFAMTHCGAGLERAAAMAGSRCSARARAPHQSATARREERAKTIEAKEFAGFKADNETVSIPTAQNLKIVATEKFITNCRTAQARDSPHKSNLICGMSGANGDEKLAEGVLTMKECKAPKILCEDELLQFLGTKGHSVQFIGGAETGIVDDLATE